MSMSKVLDMTNSRQETLRYPNPIPPVFVFFVVALVVGGALVAYLWLNPDVAGFPRTEKLGQHVPLRQPAVGTSTPLRGVHKRLAGTAVPLRRGIGSPHHRFWFVPGRTQSWRQREAPERDRARGNSRHPQSSVCAIRLQDF